MSKQGRIAIGGWLLFVLICIGVISQAQFNADLSVFLPHVPTQEQQLLIEQIKSGMASRLILIGITGGTVNDRVQASKALTTRLRANLNFLHVANGETAGMERDRKVLVENRYLLSPAVDATRFTVAGLRAAITNSIELLALSTGLVIKVLLPYDPTGEFMQILDSLDTQPRPHLTAGVWMSRDEHQALLLARTRVEGTDTDGQERAVNSIRTAFQELAMPKLNLVMTGPGPFSVAARNTIKGEVAWLSSLSALIIVSLLLSIYRSPTVVLLSLLPVLSGIVAGVAAVSLGFGTVYGVTLGFGTALIGEAIDYSIYLFVQSPQWQPSNQAADVATVRAVSVIASTAAGDGKLAPLGTEWVSDFWPIIRIGVLTSICGFASLLFSAFPGLAQLGLYATVGLLTAALVTRWVLPHLLPATVYIRDLSAGGMRLQGWLVALAHWRWLVLGLFLAATCVLITQRHSIWNTELAALSPIPSAVAMLDGSIRQDLGVPEMRYIIVVTAPSAQLALVKSEQVGIQLVRLVQSGVIAGFDSPAIYLPSVVTQQRRLASLPDTVELRQRFQAAIAGLPLRAVKFEPFFTDVASASHRTPIQRADLKDTSLAQGVDALLFRTHGCWMALLPLRLVVKLNQRELGTMEVAALRTALATTGLNDVYFVDIKGESNHLYSGYLQEVIWLSLAGFGAIVVLLLIATTSVRSTFRIVTPLVIAVTIVMAGLVLSGQKLTLLHLIGMLLSVAIGSNYALFFDRSVTRGSISPRTLASLLLANTTTVIGFGLLGFSSVPVLNAIGMTVGPGTVLALIFSAILIR